MDRRGPRLVIEMGIGLMAAGMFLATLTTEPWHLYATLGVLVGGGSVCLSYSGQSLFLPNWFARRRGLAISIAFSGVGVGSIILLPWVQILIERAGWRTACWTMGLLLLGLLAPLNLLLRQRPEELGLLPDGDGSPAGAGASPANVVDPVWVATDWTLARAIRTARFWWIALGFFCALFAWYAVQVHQTKYLVEIGFGSIEAAWALGLVSLFAIPGQIALGHLSDRIGREWVWTAGTLGFADLLHPVADDAAHAGSRAALPDGGGTRRARLWPDLGARGDPGRDLSGPALRLDLRHVDAGFDVGRGGRALGDRGAARHDAQLCPGLCDRDRLVA